MTRVGVLFGSSTGDKCSIQRQLCNELQYIYKQVSYYYTVYSNM